MNKEGLLARLAASVEPFAALFDIFENAGFQLYAVGGCVRDWCLGKMPKDVDFTTDATPAETSRILADHGMKVIPVGEAFGTIATLIGRESYEITSFRVKESYTKGSRHPVVRYGHSLEQDLERRDLTINAMAVDRHGNLKDPFDGAGDLENGLLRVPHSSEERSVEIFTDDPLRILRLARFLARLGFAVAPEATVAAKRCAGDVLLVSHERWFAELDGLLRAPHVTQAIEWLSMTGVLGLLLPEIASLGLVSKTVMSLSGDCVACENSPTLLQQTTRLVEACKAFDADPWATFLAYAGCMFTNDGKNAANVSQLVANAVLLRLKVSNAFRERTLRLMQPLPPGMPTRRLARERAQILLDDLPLWLRCLEARKSLLPDDTREDEMVRLMAWNDALKPWLRDPASACIEWPEGFSKALANALGIKGKSLGLCIKFCHESVLNEEISEHDDMAKIIDWAKKHFVPEVE